MTTESLTCPYCNASLGIQAGLSAGQRVVCPRCGDSFPPRPADAFSGQPAPPPLADTAITGKPSAAGAMSPRPDLSLPSRRSNVLVAGLVLGLMFLMASGGLVFMLMTQQQRRGYDTSRPPRRPGKQRGAPEESNPPSPLVPSVAPNKLAALGYLPSGVNFLFAARFAELRASPVGAQLLRDPIKIGGLDFRLENLPSWLGFALEDIDHLVFAARIDGAVPPPFYVVLRTAQPYDADQLRQRLKCTRVASPSKKKLYAFRLPLQEIQPKAWFADERTVVLALFANLLEPLPPQPVEDLQQLPKELRTVLKERREPVAPLWIAGHSRDWLKTSAALFLDRMKKEDLGKLSPLRTFGIWIVPDNALVIKGVFACKDEAGARGLEEFLRVLRGPDDNFKTALDGPWLTLQYQTGPDFLARVLKR
ncbi:MAG: hypothetical protein ACYC3I_18050 [Gemmataceae bacterium]